MSYSPAHCSSSFENKRIANGDYYNITKFPDAFWFAEVKGICKAARRARRTGAQIQTRETQNSIKVIHCSSCSWPTSAAQPQNTWMTCTLDNLITPLFRFVEKRGLVCDRSTSKYYLLFKMGQQIILVLNLTLSVTNVFGHINRLGRTLLLFSIIRRSRLGSDFKQRNVSPTPLHRTEEVVFYKYNNRVFIKS